MEWIVRKEFRSWELSSQTKEVPVTVVYLVDDEGVIKKIGEYPRTTKQDALRQAKRQVVGNKFIN